jgi:hypothetical protein
MVLSGCPMTTQLISIPTAPRGGIDGNGNGIPDDWEDFWNLDPDNPDLANNDTDGDGLSDEEEYNHDTDPTKADTDGDGMNDRWEIEHGLNPNSSRDKTEDADHDGLTNFREWELGTDPKDKDTDNDGWDDYWEVEKGTDPLSPNDPDRDDDGLPDAAEEWYHTDPDDPDSDGDGHLDGWEVKHGYDPLDPDDPADGDGDEFPDDWELGHGYDPADPADPSPDGDDDHDGLSNQEEFERGTDPKNPDTDGDGMPDGWEVDNGLDPLDPSDAAQDLDEDGLSNRDEYDWETDPNVEDSDNDGFRDGWEVGNGYNPTQPGDLDPNGDDDGDGLSNREEYENGTDPKVSSTKRISAFSITSPVTATGTINETAKTIRVTVPYGTALTGMTASITHNGASISPDPAAGRTYANTTVNYWVTAQDGSKQKYMVTVQTGKNSAADITGFSINGANGSISGDTISLTLPSGTNLTSLTPVISLSPGATVNPPSGQAQNFTNQVTYTVTAEDETTTKPYTVTVSAAPSGSLKQITAFSLTNGTDTYPGTVDEDQKIITVPISASDWEMGFPINRLYASYISYVGASISPGTSVLRDFTYPVTYTVSAQDGSTQDYTVIVYREPGTPVSGRIVYFSVTLADIAEGTPLTIQNSAVGEIDETNHTITVTLPGNLQGRDFVTTIVTDPAGATVSPASGSSLPNFRTGGQTYTVTPPGGSQGAYTLDVYWSQM